MTVNGEAISQDQIDAGMAAMVGVFRAWDVRHALARAGVENTDRTADRLLQKARKLNAVKAVNNKVWKAL